MLTARPNTESRLVKRHWPKGSNQPLMNLQKLVVSVDALWIVGYDILGHATPQGSRKSMLLTFFAKIACATTSPLSLEAGKFSAETDWPPPPVFSLTL